jgi:hypothetical protein
MGRLFLVVMVGMGLVGCGRGLATLSAPAPAAASAADRLGNQPIVLDAVSAAAFLMNAGDAFSGVAEDG